QRGRAAAEIQRVDGAAAPFGAAAPRVELHEVGANVVRFRNRSRRVDVEVAVRAHVPAPRHVEIHGIRVALRAHRYRRSRPMTTPRSCTSPGAATMGSTRSFAGTR